MPLKVILRHIFIWAPRSNKIEMMITNPKLVASCSVYTDVCVRKPGPMEEFAIKNAAPKLTPVKEGSVEAGLVFFNFNLVCI
jgi:hypothetical protein